VIRLDPESVEAIAVRVAELLREEAPSDARLLPASEVARRFGLSRDYLYRHAEELGAVRVGDGKRPRLRFDPEVVAERLSARSIRRGSEPRKARPKAKPRRARRTGPRSGPALLPIRPTKGTEARLLAERRRERKARQAEERAAAEAGSSKP
jgi:AraC-like DNA-binding protein